MHRSIDRDRIALGVQQPWAELIVRGGKTVEVRSAPTRVRGRIYIYASKRPSALPDATTAAARHGLTVESLPAGVIVGAADLIESRPADQADATASCVGPQLLTGRFAWHFENAERFPEPISVRFIPYGIWFYPFRRKGGAD